jgi:hypothetical protein
MAARGGADMVRASGPSERRGIAWFIGAFVTVEALVLGGMLRTQDGPTEAIILGVADTRPAVESGAPATKPDSRLTRLPRFEDYPVASVFRGVPAVVDLDSHPGARDFRTRLRAGAAEGPNFAGHYVVVSWGCGTDCQNNAIVDVASGKVIVMGIGAELGVSFRLSSRLLIANAPEDFEARFGPPFEPDWTAEDRKRMRPLFGHTRYYVLEGARVTLVAEYDPEVDGIVSRR